MQDLIINVTQIEEWQTLNDKEALHTLFVKAHVIVGGGTIVLTRLQSNGEATKFDTITTEQDLTYYKNSVYKYLG
jgi:hypothetical protein